MEKLMGNGQSPGFAMSAGYRYAVFAIILGMIGAAAFLAGVVWSERDAAAGDTKNTNSPRVVYPKRTDLDFEGMAIQGQLRNPGEFYFQHRENDKFDSLVKRRKNFHREMLRDGLMTP
jgi:spermidine/putrescine-binding protein